jgi:predicted PurR-regulated permease PerM
MVGQVTDLATNVTVYAENATQAVDRLTRKADQWYEKHRKTLTSLGMTDKPSDFMRRQAGPVSAAVGRVLDSVRQSLVGMVGQVLWLVIIPVSLFYFLLDYPVLRRRAVGFLPVSRRREADRMLGEVVEVFGAYVRGLTKVCILYGATAGILFWILRLRYAMFLGAAAGVFYAVPYVGPALAAISVAVIALTTGKIIAYTVLAIVLFLAMHVSFDYGITPRVVGGSVGLHPLVNIFALMCGVTLFGVWGMILAVPVAASLQRILVHLFPRLAEPPDFEEHEVEKPAPS